MNPSLEQDMQDNKWFVDKVRATNSYAQNVYAALCNNTFQKLEVISVLKDEVWSCTWRYAGGLVAKLRREGDYMDWYCSGMGFAGDEGYIENGYVHESHITDEVREDLKQLGWIALENNSDDL
jgi:hypothetical protein